MEFEWDDAKAASNLRKHGVSFDEACEVFGDPNGIERFDVEHSLDEERSIRIGYSQRLRLLVVVYTVRHGDTIRIISARKAGRADAREYEQAQG